MLARSYKNSGTLADCLIDWTGADTVESRVVCVRLAQTLNMLHSALKGR